jgi:outer membrane receptor protein involved in Fe transport
VRNIEKQQNPTWLKTAFAGITIISFLIFSNTASAFTKVGSGELIVGATARVGHDSNIFGNSSQIDDSFFSIVPELLFVKDDSRSTINGRIATDITRYGDRSDEDFAAIPKLTYSLSAMAILPTAIGDFAPRLSMYYRDELYTGLDATAWDPEFRDLATIDDVTLWNFRLGYTPINKDNIQVFLYVDNLTDESYFQGGFSNTESLGAGSYVLGTPRTYGIEASIAF